MESALLKAKSEMDVAKGRAQELEALILKKDQVISEQKALHNQILVFQYFMFINDLNQDVTPIIIFLVSGILQLHLL